MHAGDFNIRSADRETELEQALVGASYFALHPVSGIDRKQDQDVYTSIILEARQYIHHNFCQKITVDEIARKVFVSQYHFSRIFKKYTRYSPYQYLLNVRLQHARKLMCQPELSIKEITFKSGFSSIDHFSAAFSKKYGVCPSAYRRDLRGLMMIR